MQSGCYKLFSACLLLLKQFFRPTNYKAMAYTFASFYINCCNSSHQTADPHKALKRTYEEKAEWRPIYMPFYSWTPLCPHNICFVLNLEGHSCPLCCSSLTQQNNWSRYQTYTVWEKRGWKEKADKALLLASKTIAYRYFEWHNYWYGSLGVHKDSKCYRCCSSVLQCKNTWCTPDDVHLNNSWGGTMKFCMSETKDTPMLLWGLMLQQKTVAFVYLEKAIPPKVFE